MDESILLAAQPVVRGHAQEQHAARLEDPPNLFERRGVAGHTQVVDDFEARGRVEGGGTKGQTFYGGAGKTSQAAAASWLECFPGQVDADDLPETTQLDGGAAGAAARVQNAQPRATPQGTFQHAQGH